MAESVGPDGERPDPKKPAGCGKKGAIYGGGALLLIIVIGLIFGPNKEERAALKRVADSARVADSMYVITHRADSTDRAARAKKVWDSINNHEEKAKAAAAARRSAISTPRPETYNGHEVHIGPRGGKYYTDENGKQRYIKQ
jgi:hypothetical protein